MDLVRGVAIVGSLRAGSVNRATARAAIANAPDGLDLSLHPIADVPLYNGDVEARRLPPSVARLHDAARSSDAIIFFTPEYNSSLPAVTKNVIDWLSRPPHPAESVAVTAVATTPGRRAGAGVREHFAQIMSHQPVQFFDPHGIGSYRDHLDENGELTGAEAVGGLVAFLERFTEFARTTPTI